MKQRAYQFLVKTRCRCSNQKCRRRVTRSRHPDHYVHDKWRTCAYCGSPLSVDTYRDTGKEQRKDLRTGRTCRCDAALWPHTAGTVEGCTHREAHVTKQLDDQIDDILNGTASPIWSDNEAPF